MPTPIISAAIEKFINTKIIDKNKRKIIEYMRCFIFVGGNKKKKSVM